MSSAPTTPIGMRLAASTPASAIPAADRARLDRRRRPRGDPVRRRRAPRRHGAKRRAQRVGRDPRRSDDRSRSPRRDRGRRHDGARRRRRDVGPGRARAAEHGLGISSGDTASVGVGGLTLGGGIGWMVRAWGLAADQLVGAQVVTAAWRGHRGDRGIPSRADVGAARRRRQLRRRHALRLPGARAHLGGVRDPRRSKATRARSSERCETPCATRRAN